MSRRKDRKPRSVNDKGPAVVYKPLEVSAKECNGDTTKMIKKFVKKVRKEEVLKPYYRRLMYFETKSQKRRQKKIKSIYEHRRNEAKMLNDQTDKSE